MQTNIQVLGLGIYSSGEAARLIGAKRSEVVNWALGASDRSPLWRSQYADLIHSREIGFADLVELRVVKAMRNAGLSLQSIRFAIDTARERFGIERPLSTARFKIDGHEILLDLEEEEGLVSLSKRRAGQKVFRVIVQQSLSDLEFDDERPSRWLPKNARRIVIDPARLFGQPILEDYGVSTRVLKEDYDHFGNLGYVAKAHDLPESQVRAGVNFERSLDGQGPL